MLKLCENGSNIDYLYETSSVLRKATETEISGLTFWLQFGSIRVFKNQNRTEIRFLHISIVNLQISVSSETLTRLPSVLNAAWVYKNCKFPPIVAFISCK